MSSARAGKERMIDSACTQSKSNKLGGEPYDASKQVVSCELEVGGRSTIVAAQQLSVDPIDCLSLVHSLTRSISATKGDTAKTVGSRGSRTMYTTGWGFRTNWFCLVQAALAWRTVRQFRLARTRLEKQRADGTRPLTLADLPQEVFNMIGEYVTISACAEVIQQEPWNFETSDCCRRAYDAFFDREELWMAFDDYTAALGEDSFLRGDLNTLAFKAFGETPAYDALLDPWMIDHALG
jgi:hypothetical protein